MGTPKISAFVVCGNEEHNIERCLASLSWVDELVVVDSNSSDGTPEIARKHATHFEQQAWQGYREQKEYAASLTTHEWVLYLDADERVSDELREEIRAALSDPGDSVAYRMPRRTFYLGRWIRHGGWYPDYCIRLFRRDKGRFGGVNPHETWVPDGVLETLRSDLVHYTYRNLSDHVQRVDRFSDIAARSLVERGMTGGLWWRMLVRPPLKFLSSYFLKLGFLDSLPGLLIAVNSAYNVYLRHAKVWEATRLERQHFPDDFPHRGTPGA
jgi:glycosyltransferase involved in cell wall biosynthesis